MLKIVPNYKIGVIGTGFVGSAVSAGLQSILGNDVDIREHDKYKNSESLESVISNSNITFLCLPTPMAEDGSCDLSIIESVLQEISDITDKRKLLVIKSTVPPGATFKFQEKYKKFDIIFNPEFLREARFIDDFIEQDRIFIGFPKNCNVKNVHSLNIFYQHFLEKRKKSMKISIPVYGLEIPI